MKILVAVKQVPDPNAIRFDRSGTYAANTPRVMNEYDGYAVEEAIQLQEAGKASEVVVLTIGPAAARDVLQRALAMGADSGILVQSDDSTLAPQQVAQVIASTAKEGGFDLVFVGQETSDGGSGNTGPEVAALWGVPLVSNVVEFDVDGKNITAQREVEDGRLVVGLTAPAVICALTGLNDPRSPSLKGIMAARKKPIAEQPLPDSTSSITAEWGPLYEEERVGELTVIQGDDPEAAAQQVVALLKERKLL